MDIGLNSTPKGLDATRNLLSRNFREIFSEKQEPAKNPALECSTNGRGRDMVSSVLKNTIN
jgi:hypothetical protein